MLDTLSVVAVRDKNLYFTCKNALGILILKDVGLHLILHRLSERIVTAVRPPLSFPPGDDD